jgi:hypothetical protein
VAEPAIAKAPEAAGWPRVVKASVSVAHSAKPKLAHHHHRRGHKRDVAEGDDAAITKAIASKKKSQTADSGANWFTMWR